MDREAFSRFIFQAARSSLLGCDTDAIHFSDRILSRGWGNLCSWLPHAIVWKLRSYRVYARIQSRGIENLSTSRPYPIAWNSDPLNLQPNLKAMGQEAFRRFIFFQTARSSLLGFDTVS